MQLSTKSTYLFRRLEDELVHEEAQERRIQARAVFFFTTDSNNFDVS